MKSVTLYSASGRLIQATLNPDGVSVKGCQIIYAAAGQAGEYGALACNPYRGRGLTSFWGTGKSLSLRC
jgi:hypothetical protein